MELVEQITRQLQLHDLEGRTIELKVLLAGFSAITRAKTMATLTNVTQ